MKIINPYNLMMLAGILWVGPLFATEGTKHFSLALTWFVTIGLAIIFYSKYIGKLLDSWLIRTLRRNNKTEE